VVLVLLSFVSSPWHVQFAVMADIEKFKLGSLSWDGDKNEEEFYIFLENFGSMVRSTKHGFELEDMVDSKLRRPKLSLGSVPSFLSDDPDFGVLPSGGMGAVGSPPSVNIGEVDGAGEAEGSLHSAVSGGPAASATTGHFTLGLHHTKYANLSDEAKKLDAVLYNVLKMSIKGSKQGLLSCVTFPSYVQAVCVLVKHMGISRMSRIMVAFNKLDQLQFTGDTLQFQSLFLAVKRELDNTQANLSHFVMCKLMKAFEGRSKTIQFKIAEDFNKLDLDGPVGAINFLLSSRLLRRFGYSWRWQTAFCQVMQQLQFR